MQRVLLYIIAFLLLNSNVSFGQDNPVKDSVVQLYGVVMSADSLQALPAVSIVVKNQNRGTISNDRGVFSIVVLKGDEVEFTSVGFKSKSVLIPKTLGNNQYSIIQLMVTDTSYLPATIIKPRMSREQFDREFANTVVPDDDIEIARANNNVAMRKILMTTIPVDGSEASNQYIRQRNSKLFYSGQLPPVNILNPFAWAEFIKAWKRGDYKKKN